MDRSALIILLVLISLTSTWATAGNPVAATGLSEWVLTDPALARRAGEEKESQESRTTAPVAQEESEDDDDSGNEKVFQKLSIKSFTHFLELLHSRQHSIFDSLHLEIETPPPQLS